MCGCHGRVGEDEGLGLVVLGQAVIADVVVTVAVAVLEEVDGALLDGLVEAPASHEEECDEGDCGGTKDTTDNATDDRANVGAAAGGGEWLRLFRSSGTVYTHPPPLPVFTPLPSVLVG